MTKNSNPIQPSQAQYSPNGEPEKVTYPTNMRFRLIILIIGVVLLMIGVVVLLWVTFRPKTQTTPPNSKVKQFEQNQEEDFINREGTDEPQAEPAQ